MFPIAIGTPEIAIIVGIGVLLFGIKRLPEIGRSLAEGIHEFKKASRKVREEDAEEATGNGKPETDSRPETGSST